MTAAVRARTPREVMPPAGGGPYLTTVEVAAELRRSPKTLRAWRYLGRGPAYLPGGRVLYARVDVDAWLASNRVTT